MNRLPVPGARRPQRRPVLRRATHGVLAAAGPLLIFAIGFAMGFTLAVAWATAP